MILTSVNLNPYFNHKLIYDALPDDGADFGLDRICILRKHFVRAGQSSFVFGQGLFDNISCEGQEMCVGDMAKKIHILGFSYWGCAAESLLVRNRNGKTNRFEVLLPDWSQPAENAGTSAIGWNHSVSDEEIFVSSGRLTHLIFLHRCVCALDSVQEIESIILPDNMFMHIFALALEN